MKEENHIYLAHCFLFINREATLPRIAIDSHIRFQQILCILNSPELLFKLLLQANADSNAGILTQIFAMNLAAVICGVILGLILIENIVDRLVADVSIGALIPIFIVNVHVGLLLLQIEGGFFGRVRSIGRVKATQTEAPILIIQILDGIIDFVHIYRSIFISTTPFPKGKLRIIVGLNYVVALGHIILRPSLSRRRQSFLHDYFFYGHN